LPTVFLSYRRSDLAGEVGRLADTMQQKMGGGFAFRDVTNIPLGAKFDQVLREELAAAKIVLVLIGPTWLHELEQRLKQPDVDYLRVEVATAMSQGKRVIPVLFRGAALPRAEAVPDDLAPLAKHQAMTIRDESWSQDVDRLLDAIGRPYRWNMLALRAAVALVMIVVAVNLALPLLPNHRANDIYFLRSLVASLAGIYALIEFAVGYRHFKRLRQGYRA